VVEVVEVERRHLSWQRGAKEAELGGYPLFNERF
jgi:hypothetical protein